MGHRAYIHKMTMNRCSLWVAVIKLGGGTKHRHVQAVITGKSLESIIGDVVARVRVLDELRGIFPDGDGNPTIEKLARHCLWCGALLPNDAPGAQFTCNRSHQNAVRASRNGRAYRPELCKHPAKRKFVHRGTAIYFAHQLNAAAGDCYECKCGTYHLTMAGGLMAEMGRSGHETGPQRGAL